MTRLNVIWKSNSMSFPVKLKLFKSLVVSILLYGCKCWNITADLKRRLQAFEHTCYRRLLRISYTEHRSNEFVRQQVTNYAGTTHGHGQATETGLVWPHLPSEDRQPWRTMVAKASTVSPQRVSTMLMG